MKYRHKNNKTRLFFTFFLTISFTMILTFLMCKSISDIIIMYSKSIIEDNNIKVIKNSFAKIKDVDFDKLITVIKSSKDEILEVNFNMNELYDILSNSIEEVDDELVKNEYIVNIPLGYITKSPLLMNMGPKIPLKINALNDALANIRTEVSSFGINNALIEVYLDINFNVFINSSIQIEKEEKNYQTLLISKVISGRVPDFYGGSYKEESNDISIPLFN